MRNNKHSAGGKSRKLALAGWIFLGAAILLAVAAIIFLAPKRELEVQEWTPGWIWRADSQTPTPEPSPAAGGKAVSIDGVLCAFTPPEELTFGVVRSVDFSDAAQQVCAAVSAAGWGDVVSSREEDGAQLFYPRSTTVLPGDKYQQQADFLKSDRPVKMARVFLTDSGLVSLLRQRGIELSLQPENNGGEVVFTGTTDAGGECRLRLNFLYDGSLNQARLYAVTLSDAVTTQSVTPLGAAVTRAVSWSSAGEAPTQVTAAEIRSINGIPLYVLTCADGSTAYALAVDEAVLATVPEAQAVYQALLQNGIQEYVRTEGAGT